MQKERQAPPLPAQAPLATKDSLLFPPLNVFLGYEIPHLPPLPQTLEAALGSWVASQAPTLLEGRAADRLLAPSLRRGCP